MWLAAVSELADERALEACGRNARVGSTPTSRIRFCFAVVAELAYAPG